MVPMEGNCCENIRMNVASESRNEANNKKNCHLGPKQVLKVEAWNVRTIYECSKSVQVVNEMRRYKLDILSISEMEQTILTRKPYMENMVVGEEKKMENCHVICAV